MHGTSKRKTVRVLIKYHRLWVAALLIICAAPALAGPLAPAGDTRLRHDVEILADAGIITGPVSTWPLAWSQVDADLQNIPEGAQFSPAVAGALARVQRRLAYNRAGSRVRKGVYARGGSDPQFLRSFDDTPRADFETGTYVDWTSGHFAGRLEVSYAHDPDDDREARLDGSWVGAVLGNWMLAAGFLDRYWGPAWQGGLIISNNARPRAGVTLRRLRTTPFETKWLSWIGPWNLTVFTERLESGRGVPNALLYGMRIAFRPIQSLTIGLSRTSQFGGEGRHLGFDTIANVISGKTTSTSSLVGNSENINSLGGFDLRWKLPYINSAVYGEFIGEDEVGSHPELFLGQGGIEFWGGVGDEGASWRLVYERTNTKANVFHTSNTKGDGDYGVAYNNSDFPTGYRYRGHAIGYPADGDALLNSARAVFITLKGDEFRMVGTTGELNRGAKRGVARAVKNSLTPRSEDVNVIDLGYSTLLPWFKLDLGLGYTHREYAGGDKKTVHGWVGFNREFD